MALVMLAGVSGDAMAAAPELGQMPSPFGEAPTSGAQSALRILALMTVLSLLPSLVLTMTCFTRIIIVFSFLRQALGIQGMPPNQILVGMALFLSMFIMAPVVDRIHEDAVAPLMNDTIGVAPRWMICSISGL